MSEKIILAITGFAKAGKSEVTDYLVTSYGFTSIKPSSIIKSELIQRYGERVFSRAEYRQMGEELRQIHGAAYYLNSPLVDSNRILIDGPRHLSSVEAIKARGGIALGVVAQHAIRFQRAKDAGDKAVPDNFDAFMADERVELNDISGRGGQILPILWSIASQDIIDTSVCTLQETHRQLDDIMYKHYIDAI